MHRREQEIARRVAREDPTGPVAAVRRRRQPDDEDPRVRVAETRDGPAPVRLVAEPGDLLAGDLLAPGDEAGAAPAGDDLGCQLGKLVGARTSGRWRRGAPPRTSVSERRFVTQVADSST
jgi:hypothetical protein